MAQFELNIYDDDNNVVNRFATDRVRWGIFVLALELEENLKGATAREMFLTVSEFVKKIFPSITDEDLEKADVDDVLNTFRQVLAKAGKIGGGAKNGAGAD